MIQLALKYRNLRLAVLCLCSISGIVTASVHTCSLSGFQSPIMNISAPGGCTQFPPTSPFHHVKIIDCIDNNCAGTDKVMCVPSNTNQTINVGSPKICLGCYANETASFCCPLPGPCDIYVYSGENTTPSVTEITKTELENTLLNFTIMDFTSHFYDPDRNKLAKILVVTLPTNGTLYLSGLVTGINQTVEVTDLGKLSFIPTTNWKGTTTFLWNGHDGVSYAETPANVTITISNQNPAITNLLKTGCKNIAVKFNATDFTSKFSDADPLTKIKILNLPSNYTGTLKLSGTAVFPNQEIASTTLTDLTFDPATNWTGVSTFTWNGNDGALYANNSANVTIAINDLATPIINNISTSVTTGNTLTITINVATLANTTCQTVTKAQLVSPKEVIPVTLVETTPGVFLCVIDLKLYPEILDDSWKLVMFNADKNSEPISIRIPDGLSSEIDLVGSSKLWVIIPAIVVPVVAIASAAAITTTVFLLRKYGCFKTRGGTKPSIDLKDFPTENRALASTPIYSLGSSEGTLASVPIYSQ